jgi:RimJ/RimL family protein N-acetyltransferase
MDEPLPEKLRTIVADLKENPADPDARLPVFLFGRRVAWLTPMGAEEAKQKKTLALLARWHRQSLAGGPSLAPSAVVGPERWLNEQIQSCPDHLLFWVRDLDDTPIGHLGLCGLDAPQNRAEIGYILRGVPNIIPGAMYGATQALIGWAFQVLPITQVSLRVFPNNPEALRLVERCGFTAAPGVGDPRQKNSRQAGGVVNLRLTRSEWMEAHRICLAA